MTSLDQAREAFKRLPCYDTALDLLLTAASFQGDNLISPGAFDAIFTATEPYLINSAARLCAEECVQVLSDGWGEKEERRAVEEIVPIINRYLSLERPA